MGRLRDFFKIVFFFLLGNGKIVPGLLTASGVSLLVSSVPLLLGHLA